MTKGISYISNNGHVTIKTREKFPNNISSNCTVHIKFKNSEKKKKNTNYCYTITTKFLHTNNQTTKQSPELSR